MITQDWRIRATIDGTSFIIENWQPIYLTGLKPGDNWVTARANRRTRERHRKRL